MFWCTFSSASLEREYLGDRWRSACFAMRWLAISFTIAALVTLRGSAPYGAKPEWKGLVGGCIAFNLAVIGTTMLSRRWHRHAKLFWIALCWTAFSLCTALSVMSRNIAWDALVNEGYTLNPKHDSCVGDTIDVFAKWQVAHVAFFTLIIVLAALVFSRAVFAVSLPLAVFSMAGLLFGVLHALGNSCFGFGKSALACVLLDPLT
jgi:hypothetical protein